MLGSTNERLQLSLIRQWLSNSQPGSICLTNEGPNYKELFKLEIAS